MCHNNRELTSQKKITWWQRATALLLTLSLALSFVVPVAPVLGVAAVDVYVTPDGYFTIDPDNNKDIPRDVPNNADPLDGKIQSLNISSSATKISESPLVFDAGSADLASLNISMEYKYTESELQASGILDYQLVYFKIPPGISVQKDYYGNSKQQQVTDSSWKTSEPSGYFSISREGYIVIRFTDNYVNYLKTSKDGFKGTISFSGNVLRDDTADGDRTVTVAGEEIKVKFNDDKLTMTKDGEVKKDDNNEKYILWTVTVNNPKGHIDLSKYTLKDTATESHEENYQTVSDTFDWSKMEVQSIVPSGVVNNNGNGEFTFNTVENFPTNKYPEKVIITYKQSAPANGHKFNNTATIESDDDKDVKPASKEIPIQNKIQITKDGTPDYYVDGLGANDQIQWKITVENLSGDSLNEVKVTDERMDFPSNTKIYYNNADGERVELESGFTISEREITFDDSSPLPSKAEIVFLSTVDFESSADPQAQASQTNKAKVESTRTDSEKPEGSETYDIKKDYKRQLKVDKAFDSFNADDETVKWKIVVTANATGEYRVDGNSKATVDGYTVQDDAFAGLDVSKITFNAAQVTSRWQDNAKQDRDIDYSDTKTDKSNLITLSKDTASDTLTINLTDEAKTNGEIVNMVELYYTQPLSQVQFSEKSEGVNYTVEDYKAGNEVLFTNEATGQHGDYSDSGVGNGKAKMRIDSEKHLISVTPDTLEATGKNDKEDRILEWDLTLVKDSGFAVGDSSVTDIMQSDNGGAHYITPEQAKEHMTVMGRTSESSTPESISGLYDILFYETYETTDENAIHYADFIAQAENAVKFKIVFKEGITTDTKKFRYIDVDYKTTANIENVENGTEAVFSNKYVFNGETKTSEDTVTFERKDPNPPDTLSLNFTKKWNDRNNAFDTRPETVTINVYKARQTSDGTAPDVNDADAWGDVYKTFTLNASKLASEDSFTLADDFPQWDVDDNGCTVPLYYRIEEVNEDNGYELVPENDTVQLLSVKEVLLAPNNKRFRITNKNESNGYGKYALDANLGYDVMLENQDYSQLAKATLDLGDGEKEYFIFKWSLQFDTGIYNESLEHITYIDTLPKGAIYLGDKNIDAYKSTVAYGINSSNEVNFPSPYVRTIDWTNNITVTYQDDSARFNASDGTLTLSLSENVWRFKYYMAVPVDDLSDALTNGKLVNKLKTVDGDEKEGSLEIKNVPVKPDAPAIEKGWIDSIVSGYVNYYIEFNPEGRQLSNDDYVSIMDELMLAGGSSKTDDQLDYVLDSIVVYNGTKDNHDEGNPVTDFSYTREFHVTENRNITVVQEENNFWRIEGWEAGDEITIIAEQNSDDYGNLINMNSVIFPSDVNVTDDNGVYGSTRQNLSAYANGKSKTTYIVPDNCRYLKIKDWAAYNGATIKSLTVTGKKVTSALLNLEVPDRQPLYIEYKYRVTGYTPNTDTIKFKNKASYTADNGSGWDTTDENTMEVTESSATSEALKYPQIFKVDVNDFKMELDAVFKVAKYDGSQWVYASDITTKDVIEDGEVKNRYREFTFPTNTSGYTEISHTAKSTEQTYPTSAKDVKFSVEDDTSTENDKENIHNFTLEPGTLYKFVEIVPPQNYLRPDWDKGGFKTNEDFVFYYSYDGYNGTIPADAKTADGKSKVQTIPINGTFYITNNKRITVSAKKKFSSEDENIPEQSQVVLELYYATKKDGSDKQKVTESVLSLTDEEKISILTERLDYNEAIDKTFLTLNEYATSSNADKIARLKETLLNANADIQYKNSDEYTALPEGEKIEALTERLINGKYDTSFMNTESFGTLTDEQKVTMLEEVLTNQNPDIVFLTNPQTVVYGGTSENTDIAEWSNLPNGNDGSSYYYFVVEKSFQAYAPADENDDSDAETQEDDEEETQQQRQLVIYSYDSETGKYFYHDGDEKIESSFKPVYTKNGTNKDGTQIEVNNSEGVMVIKSWIDTDGQPVEPPYEVDSETEKMSIKFDVYAVKGIYSKIKLDLTDEQRTLTEENGYKFKLPDEVGLTGVSDSNMIQALEYEPGKKYPLSYFDRFEVKEILEGDQPEALKGKFTQKTQNGAPNGVGTLEMQNITSSTVNAIVEKKWNDNNAAHSGDTVQMILVQSTKPAPTDEAIYTKIASGKTVDDVFTGNNIKSTDTVKLLDINQNPKNGLEIVKTKEIDSVEIANDKYYTAELSEDKKTITITQKELGSSKLTIKFKDKSEESMTISVIEYESTLGKQSDDKVVWQKTLSGLPRAYIDNDGKEQLYYYYFVEKVVPDGYKVKYDVTQETNGQKTTVTNRKTTELVIQKKWLDSAGEIITDEKAAGYDEKKLEWLPNTVTVEIYQKVKSDSDSTGFNLPSSGNDINSLTTGTPIREVTLEKEKSYQFSVGDLPASSDSGEEYIYYVKESGNHTLSPDGSYYTLSEYDYIESVTYQNNGQTTAADSTITITNKLKTIDLKLIKDWADGNEKHPSGEIKVEIHRETAADAGDSTKNPLTLTLDKNNVSIPLGSTDGIKVTANQIIKPSPNTVVTVSSADDGKAVVIKPSGNANAEDKTDVIVETKDGQQAVIHVTIVNAPTLKLALDKTSVKADETISVKSVTFTPSGGTATDVKSHVSYSSTGAISIDAATGEMTINNIGDATITATYNDNGNSVSDTVNVTVSLSDSFTADDVTVTVNGTNSITITPPYGTFKYKSADTSIATVNENGIVTGISSGETTITITREDDVTNEIKVTVDVATSGVRVAESVNIDNNSQIVNLDDSKKVTQIIFTVSSANNIYGGNEVDFEINSVSWNFKSKVRYSISDKQCSEVEKDTGVSSIACTDNVANLYFDNGITLSGISFVIYNNSINISDVRVVYQSDSSNSTSSTQSIQSAGRAAMTRFSSTVFRAGAARDYISILSTEPEAITGSVTADFNDEGIMELTIHAVASENESKTAWQEVVSGLPAYGFVDGVLTPYYYWVKEIEVVDGYKASYTFTDSDDANTNYSINASMPGDNPTITIKNTPDKVPPPDEGIELPESGGTGTAPYRTAGTAIMLTAITIPYIRRKRRNGRKSA